MRVRHALDRLLDDRAFVEVVGHVVRRGADDLHAARMRLRIGLGTLEARQEGVVDVDAAAGDAGAEGRCQDLHVAREHQQIGTAVLHQLQDLPFLHDPVGRVHRHEVVGQAVEFGELAHVLVVRDDAHDVRRKLAATPAVYQIVEAVAELRHRHQHFRAMAEVVQFPLHVEARCDRSERRPQGLETRESRAGGAEHHPHVEHLRFRIIELRRFDDRAIVVGEAGGDSGDDALGIRAAQDEDEGGAHGAIIGRAARSQQNAELWR